MDDEFYKEKLQEALSDTQCYQKLQNNPHKQIMKNYTKLIWNYEHFLTDEESGYLIQFWMQNEQLLWITKSS